MMEKIHAAANHVVVKIIFVLIMIGFVFAGISGVFTAGSSVDENKYIAEVNGEGISRLAFENEARAATQNSSSNDASLIQTIRREVLNQQIDDRLLNQYAKALKINISNQQVKDVIRQQQVFFKDGKFNNDLYLQLLQANGFTPDAYAETLRGSLALQQLVQALAGTDFVLPVDSEISKLQNQQRTVALAKLPASSVKVDEQQITSNMMQQYYQQNKAAFYHKERVKVSYIANFLPDIIKNTPKPTKQEISNYFEAHKAQYQFPAKQQYSVITVNDQTQAKELYTQLQQGQDFNRLAEQVAKQAAPELTNGDLGWFTIDQSLPKFLAEAKLTQKGSYSQPIAYNGNYLLLYVNNVQPARAMPLNYASAEIEAKLFKQRYEATFAANTKKLQQALQNQPTSLAAIAKATGLPISKVDWSYYDENMNIVRFPEIRDVVFSDQMIQNGKPSGRISDLINISDYQANYVLQVTDYQPEGTTSFADAATEIKQKLYQQLQKQQFVQQLNKVMQHLQTDAKASSLHFGKPMTVTRDAKDLDADTVAMIFALVPDAANKATYGSMINRQGDGIIAKLEQVKMGSQQDLSRDLKPLLMQDNYFNLLKALRGDAKIKVFAKDNV